MRLCVTFSESASGLWLGKGREGCGWERRGRREMGGGGDVLLHVEFGGLAGGGGGGVGDVEEGGLGHCRVGSLLDTGWV